jgi:hypothetical protein
VVHPLLIFFNTENAEKKVTENTEI